MPTLSPLKIFGRWFVDTEGRKVILRGVNLGGSSKVPYSPDGATQNKVNWPPSPEDWQNVSWVGRPFPREEAEEHFSRLKAWGFNCLRFLTTWEAIEHAGPYEYDEEYLDYYADMVAEASKYGFYVFVDPHQDVWSRVTGGDGAPLWLFDKLGLDYSKFDEAGLAINMQYLWDPDPKKNKYGQMVWGENLKSFPNGTMWTLFFGGRDFAPKFYLEDESTGQSVNVQDYLQGHYLQSLVQIAKRVKDFSHVFGFDTLNEPHHGFIGHKAISRNLRITSLREPPLPGLAWSPVDGMYAAAGHSFPLERIGIKISKLTLAPVRTEVVNPRQISVWNEGAVDFWQENGVWSEGDGLPSCPNDDYFCIVNGQSVDFTRDYLLPLASRVAETVREYNPDWLVLVEDDPVRAIMATDAGWPTNTPPNMVNCFHWYDAVLSEMKRFLWPLTLDVMRIRLIWGLRGIQKMYLRQLGIQPELSTKINGGCPCLVGEFGSHMDLQKGKAYKRWKKQGNKAFKWETIALDLMYNALDALLLSSTQWNYTADNTNRFGDNWNQEDLSLFSRDQQKVDWREDINAGGRAMEGFCRPFARLVAGTPTKMSFSRKSGRFQLEYEANLELDVPTEVYVPPIQYPHGFDVTCTGATWEMHPSEPLILITRPDAAKIILRITRKP